MESEADTLFPGCPRCKTLYETVKSLRVLFSTCCGRKLCTDCIKMWLPGKRTLKCDICGEMVKASSFVEEPLETQEFEKENEIRRKLAERFDLRREDFGSVREYDAYLEMVEDLIYELAYGSATERRAAEKRVTVYANKNKDRIRASKVRLSEEKLDIKLREAKRMQEEAAAVDAAVAQQAEAQGGGFFAAPAMMQPMQVPAPLEADAEKDFNKYKKRRIEGVRREASPEEKAAGGYKPEYDWQRLQQESFGALTLGLARHFPE